MDLMFHLYYAFILSFTCFKFEIDFYSARFEKCIVVRPGNFYSISVKQCQTAVVVKLLFVGLNNSSFFNYQHQPEYRLRIFYLKKLNWQILEGDEMKNVKKRTVMIGKVDANRRCCL